MVLGHAGRRTVVFILSAALAAGVPAGDTADPIAEIKALLAAGKYAEAQIAAQARLSEVESESGVESAETARVLDLLVESLWRGGRSTEPESRELAERAVAVREKVLGPDHIDLANSLSNLANVIRAAGDYAVARPLMERALAIREKNLGPEHVGVARSMSLLASMLVDAGDYAAARPLHERALAIREKALGPDSPEVAASLHNLSILHWYTGDYAAARPLSERALAIDEKALGPEHPSLGIVIEQLALILRDMGDYAGARRLDERALAIHEKALGPEHPQVAKNLNDLALIVADIGDLDEARRLNERALALREKVLGPDHFEVAHSLSNLADVYKSMGNYDAARPLAQRALAISEKAFGPDHPQVGVTLANLAILLHAMGELEAAKPLYERAMAVSEKASGSDHPYLAVIQTDLAWLLWDMGDDVAAQKLFDRALAIRMQASGPDHPLVAECRIGLARIHAGRGENLDAVNAALEGERIVRDHLRLTGRSLSERQAMDYAVVRRSGLDLALTLAARGLDDVSRRQVLDAVVRSRAVVFDEVAARHRAIGGGEDSVIGPAAELARARTRLANLVVRGPGNQASDAYRTLLDEARRNKERAERALAEASAGFARESSRARLGIDEVAGSLPPGSALLTLVRYKRFDLAVPRPSASPSPVKQDGPKVTDPGGVEAGGTPSYVAFVLRPGEPAPAAVQLGDADEIDALVARWREEASGERRSADPGTNEAEAAYREAGTALRRRVWDPLRFTSQTKRVFVVPDGSLNLVNLAALPVDDGAYLVERGPLLHYVSTERDLVPTTNVGSGEGILVLGSPAYDASSTLAQGEIAGQTPRPEGPAPIRRSFRGSLSSCESFRDVRFGLLPASKREADEVADLWNRRRPGNVKRLTGAAASEAAFKEMGPGRRVLHLATHGFFLGETCASAAPATGENPLLLSGLALAGANHRAAAAAGEEDGILTAEEVAAMDLSGVDWVVLSACDTGAGEYRAGEGMFGLRRAFQVAGARTVIASLWSVEDQASRAWMRDLYRERLGGAATAEAVSTASNRMIATLKRSGLPAHPYYWAGFVAVGDWK